MFKQRPQIELIFITLSFFLTLIGASSLFGQDNAELSMTLIEKHSVSPENAQLLQKSLQFYDDLRDDRSGFPPIWDIPVGTKSIHGIIVAFEANPRINDIPIKRNDYIGTFFKDDDGNDKCGGAIFWPNDSLSAIFVAFGDDGQTPVKEGFAYAEQMIFKLYSFETMKEYAVDVIEWDLVNYTGTDQWYPFGLSKALDMQALENLDFYISPSGNPICTGNEVILQGEEFIGTGGPYTFQWSSDPPGFNYTVQNPPGDLLTASKTYSLVVSDGVNTSEHTLNIEVNDEPTVDAGDGGVLCANEVFELNGLAENYTSIQWTTNGDGAFDDSGALVTSYTPGEMDKQANQITLSLTAFPLNPCDEAVSESLQVDMLKLPAVSTGDDYTVCTNEDVFVEANAQYYSSVLWTTSGSGTFTNPSELQTQYIAGVSDIANGVVLTITAYAQSPCIASDSDAMHVAYVPGPTANGPNAKTKCEDQPVPLNGNATNFSYTEWTTAGDGTFSDATTFSTTYYAGPIDRANGGVVVTFSAYPLGNCGIASKDVNINLVKRPEVITFGQYTENICVGDLYLQLDAVVENTNSVSWSTSGDGTFNITNIFNPKYYPGSQDVSNGFFELNLLSYPLPYCFGTTMESQTTTFQQNPTSNAGTDKVICQNQSITLSEAQASSAGGLLWTGGAGTFNNASILNPTYTPAPADFGSTINLCLEASPINPCAISASDCMQLYVQRLPQANAGSDADICQGNSYTISDASVLYANGYSWSGGAGTLVNASTLSPTYTPAASEYGSTVLLSLSAQAISPCSVNVTDNMELYIQKTPSVFAGNDGEVCQNQSYQLAQASSANAGNLLWSGGAGIFNNATIQNPSYTPASADFGNTITLCLVASPVSPCTLGASDCIDLFVQPLPVANAGSNATICQDDSYTIQNASATNAASYLWTGGNGSFTGQNTLSPTYTPAASEYGTTVQLVLSAQAISPCTVADFDAMNLFIQQNPNVFAGEDETICQDASITLSDANAGNYSSVNWSGGNGSFNTTSILNPTYTPAVSEYGTTVSLLLTAQPSNPCSISATDAIEVFVAQTASLEIGDDINICGAEPANITDVNADNYSTLLWVTSGDGSFSNPQIANPSYYPGTNDLINHTVELTLTVNPNSPCTNQVSDIKTINMALPPSADAGTDITSCGEEGVLLDGSASSFSSLLWTTNGSGTFDNASSPSATYYPSVADFNNREVELSLQADANLPCTVANVDQIFIEFDALDIIEDNVVDKEVNLGNLLMLSYSVNSLSQGNYKWYFNNTILEGQNGPVLLLLGMAPENAGEYYATCTNDCGTVESRTAFVEVVQAYNQDVNIPEGWSGISSFVTPNDPALESIFSGFTNNLIIMSNYSGMYWPGENINTLTDLDVTSGYQIKMEQEINLPISGKIRYPFNSLQLAPGWSYMPVNTTCAVDVEDQFASFPTIKMIKDIAGTGIYWPEFGVNTLGELLPGKAYFILNYSQNEISFKYAECDVPPMKGTAYKASLPNVNSPWNTVSNSPVSHVFGFAEYTLADFENGDVIGVFNSAGHCSGFVTVDNSKTTTSLIAFGDDIFTSQADGLTQGESVSFKLFRNSEEFDLEASYNLNAMHQGNFIENGISVINQLRIKSSTSVYENSATTPELSIYPNPTSGMVNIALDNPKQLDSGKITLTNQNGQVIAQESLEPGSTNKTLDISHFPKGVYYLRFVSNGFVKVEKLILK